MMCWWALCLHHINQSNNTGTIVKYMVQLPLETHVYITSHYKCHAWSVHMCVANTCLHNMPINYLVTMPTVNYSWICLLGAAYLLQSTYHYMPCLSTFLFIFWRMRHLKISQTFQKQSVMSICLCILWHPPWLNITFLSPVVTPPANMVSLA